MAKRRIDHFGPGALGAYNGHSVVHDDGEVDHFEYDGGIIPGEEYVGSSRVEVARDPNQVSNGGGGGGGAEALSALIFLPAVLVVGMIVFPPFWLVRRFLKGPEQGGSGMTVGKAIGFAFLGAVWLRVEFVLRALHQQMTAQASVGNERAPALWASILVTQGIVACGVLSVVIYCFDTIRQKIRQKIPKSAN